MKKALETRKRNTNKFEIHKNLKVLQSKPHGGEKSQVANLDNAFEKDLVYFNV